MDVVLLRFDAPLMSFGSVVVDHHNKTDLFPYRAMLVGLLANALGMSRHAERELTALQSRIRYAARLDRRGSNLVDYQTVDFDPEGPMGAGLGWTTRGRVEERQGGAEASEGTHIRLRHYLADAIVTVAMTLEPAEETPSLKAVSEALRTPRRPLFLGRKCCIPSGPVWLGESVVSSLRHAIVETPRAPPARPGGPLRSDSGKMLAVWPHTEGGDDDQTRTWGRVEDRDMTNAIHVGRRTYLEGLVDPPSGHQQPSVVESNR
jgi:CRISPR system Cascade subunit CasD